MVKATTPACAMVAVVAPIASMKACWSKTCGNGLLLHPSPRRPLARLAIYICQIAIESYIVSKKWGSSLNFEISLLVQLVVHVPTTNRPQPPEPFCSFFSQTPKVIFSNPSVPFFLIYTLPCILFT